MPSGRIPGALGHTYWSGVVVRSPRSVGLGATSIDEIVANEGEAVPSRENADAVDTMLPVSGLGYSTKTASRPEHQDRLWGTAYLIQLLQSVGRKWQLAHPDGPRIHIGDISKRGGGKISPHGSHQKGIDVDIAIFSKTGEGYRKTQITAPDYSRPLTQQMVSLIRELGGNRITFIFSADRQLLGVNFEQNHTWHVHLRVK